MTQWVDLGGGVRAFSSREAAQRAITEELLVAADAALERGEVPTVPHAGSPVLASVTEYRPLAEPIIYHSGFYNRHWAPIVEQARRIMELDPWTDEVEFRAYAEGRLPFHGEI
jgi:hypothetical protein